ncbi:MAG: T9SS type A sorting domain-containing protein [Bacteroidota bacterium]
MKKSILSLVLILLALLNLSFGQTVSILNYSNNNQGRFFCSPPVNNNLSFFGFYTGIALADSIELKCYWGDGNVSSVYHVISPNDSGYWSGQASHIYLNPGVYSRHFSIKHNQSGASDTLLVPDSIFIGTGCDSIYGYFYHDYNNDCHYNTGDVAILYYNDFYDNYAVYLNNTLVCSGYSSLASFNNIPGRYNIKVPLGIPGLSGQYKIKITNPAYINACCVPGAELIYSTFPTLTSSDFGFSCLNNCIDLAPYFSFIHTGLNAAVCNIFIGNSGCLNSGIYTLKVVIDPMYHYYLTFPNNYTPTIIPATTGDTLIYTFQNLPYLNQFNIYSVLAPNINVTLGATATFKCITEVNGDCNPLNNFVTDSAIVIAAIDPNDKQVTPEGNIFNMTELNYSIRFQNTGNSSASKVVLIDTLDSHLDINTFHFLGSSHPAVIQKLPGNIVKFNFDPIYLPDSGSNYFTSMGGVRFSIKPLGYYPIGTQIKNTAYIYFDDNAAVVTNTVVNTIDSTVHNQIDLIQNDNSLFTFFPNPAYNLLHIQLPQDYSTAEIKIYNLLGQIQQTMQVSSAESAINIAALARGAYMIEVRNDKNISRAKFIKE